MVTAENVRQLIDEVTFSSPPLSSRAQPDEIPWPELPAEALEGLAGEIVRTFSPHTEADDAAVLVTTLDFFGSCVGRGPHIRVGETRHGANIDAVIVGRTSRSRKGTSAAGPLRIFREVDPVWTDTRHISGIGSGEGIIWAIRDATEPRLDKKGNDVVDDPGVVDKRLMVMEEEFSSLLTVGGRDGAIVSETLRKAWDSPHIIHNAVKGKPVQATSPHISLLGHITIDELRRKLTETDKANGMANRILWFLARRSKHLPMPSPVPAHEIAPLVTALRNRVNQARKAGTFTLDDHAMELWSQVYPVLTSDQPGLFGALVARAEAHVIRLALLYALLDGAKQISPRHLLSALALWHYAEASARYIFGDRTGDYVADRIMDALRSNPRGLTETDIHELFGRNAGRSRIHAALQMLLGCGRAAVHEERTGGRGRPPRTWTAIQNATTEVPAEDYLSIARDFVSPRINSFSLFSSYQHDNTEARAHRGTHRDRPKLMGAGGSSNGHAAAHGYEKSEENESNTDTPDLPAECLAPGTCPALGLCGRQPNCRVVEGNNERQRQ